MPISRRNFLKLSGLTAVSTTVGCSVIGQQVAKSELPDALPIPPADPASVTRRLLNRAGYGARPGELAQVEAMGIAAYLEEQLHPDEIEDTAVSIMNRNLTFYPMEIGQLAEQEQQDATRELLAVNIFRPLYSKKQLYEAMVEFWSDHFNIYVRKNPRMVFLKTVDDRDVIRPHALGKFRDLLYASAKSAAMLVYLDNVRNIKEDSNENYARELMELHTLGVNGGYNQQDVQELARVLTGWGVGLRGRHLGETIFREEQHDFGEKQLLGQTIAADLGEDELVMVLDILLAHPSTATFIATKLVRRFVADEPPAALVAQVAQTFTETDGDIKSMLRILFLSDDFANAPPKLKRPLPFMISAMRAVHADMSVNARALGSWMNQLGQVPYNWPPPDGYPDVATAWATNLLPRWNFALAMVHGEINGVNAPLEEIVNRSEAETGTAVLELFSHLINGRSLDQPTRELFTTYAGDDALSDPQTRQHLQDAVAMMLASPAFQWT